MNARLAQLLVHLDTSAQTLQRLAAARQIGQAQGAAVTALYAVSPGLVELPFAPEIGPGIAASLRGIDEDLKQRAFDAFKQSLAMPGIDMAWAEMGDYPAMAAFTQQALFADLLVLGQHDPAATSVSGVPADFVESILVMSGKPALIVPHSGALPAAIGHTVVIAWKPSREAARAVSAAIPLLQQARRVVILSWSGDEEAVQGHRLNLNGYLRLHGIEAEWQHQGSENDALGEMLLSRACDVGADLLVMGCYGHSRAREWVLGGTSRTVLASMTLPVLMAH